MRTDIEGSSKRFFVHRLVAYQFCNPPSNTIEGLKQYTVNHINGDPTCNYASNLEWKTSVENVQHAAYVTYGTNEYRPIVNEAFVHAVCRLFVDGYTNIEIMNLLDMEVNDTNHGLLKSIRCGYSWKHISSQYVFDRYSRIRYYSDEDFARIEQLLLEGKSVKEVFFIMQGEEYSY